VLATCLKQYEDTCEKYYKSLHGFGLYGVCARVRL
jgi:hypothetical protein